MSDNGRRMVYPVTLPQQIKYFPFKFHWKHCSRFREIFFAVFLGVPVFYKLEKLSYSPGNVKKYEEYLEKQKLERAEHMYHLEGYYEDQHKH